MERTYAAQVRGADEIKVCGFVENIRNKSKMAFIVLKDITGKVQITVEKGEDEALDNAVNQITLDSVITVIGKAVESEYVKLGGVEIYPKQIIIESLAAPLPIDREARKGARALFHRPAHRLSLDRPAHRRESTDVQGADRYD